MKNMNERNKYAGGGCPGAKAAGIPGGKLPGLPGGGFLGGKQSETLPGGGFHGGKQSETLPGGGFHGEEDGYGEKANAPPVFSLYLPDMC